MVLKGRVSGSVWSEGLLPDSMFHLPNHFDIDCGYNVEFAFLILDFSKVNRSDYREDIPVFYLLLTAAENVGLLYVSLCVCFYWGLCASQPHSRDHISACVSSLVKWLLNLEGRTFAFRGGGKDGWLWWECAQRTDKSAGDASKSAIFNPRTVKS